MDYVIKTGKNTIYCTKCMLCNSKRNGDLIDGKTADVSKVHF